MTTVQRREENSDEEEVITEALPAVQTPAKAGVQAQVKSQGRSVSRPAKGIVNKYIKYQQRLKLL